MSTNADRRERVYAYVESYRQTWEPGGSYHEVVTDMISDLLHFMVWHGEPEEGAPTDVLESALSHFEAEVAEADDEYAPMICDACGTVGNKDDGIEIGGECPWEECGGTIRRLES